MALYSAWGFTQQICVLRADFCPAIVGAAPSRPPGHERACFDGWYKPMRLSACPPLLGKGGVGEGCSRHQWSVQARANSYKPIFGLLRIRPSFYSDQLPTANPHPTLPLQARGGMTQALEIVTNSPNLDHHCEMIPHGRLRASPTVLPLQTPIC